MKGTLLNFRRITENLRLLLRRLWHTLIRLSLSFKVHAPSLNKAVQLMVLLARTIEFDLQVLAQTSILNTHSFDEDLNVFDLRNLLAC